MKTKAKILRWFCRKLECSGRDENGLCVEFYGCDNKRECDDYNELSAMIDSLVKSCPSERITEPSSTSTAMIVPHANFVYGYNKHCDEVENWEKEVLNVV